MSDNPHTSLPPRILIACIGNIFLGDDAFGVEVARRLANRTERRYPPSVQVVDFGIRGIELAYTLLDNNYDALIMVDAVPRGGKVGTLYLIEPDVAAIPPGQGIHMSRVAIDGHSMDPVRVLALAKTLGAPPIRTLLVGCEPSSSAEEANEEMQMGLSEPVQAAIDEAVQLIDKLVDQLLTIGV